MTDIARRTYPRNDTGPRVVDPRRRPQAPESPQRRRRESSSVSFALETIGSRLPSRIQTDSRIGLRFAISTRTSGQLRNINPQGLVAVATLIDDRTGAPLPAGYLSPASSSARSRLVQPVGSAYEVAFEDLMVKQPGLYQVKVTLLRMPEASAAGGQAAHVAAWESDAIRVQSLANGA